MQLKMTPTSFELSKNIGSVIYALPLSWTIMEAFKQDQTNFIIKNQC